MANPSPSSQPAPSKKKGCLKALIILAIFFAGIKGCTAYQNRPTALYQRWLGTSVPEDVTDLKGNFTFQLTESIAWLSFKAPPERIAQIVRDRGLTLIEATPHWSVPTQSRTYSAGSSRGSGNWIWRFASWSADIPPDQQIYWSNNHPGDTSFSGGWALYYSPSTHEAVFSLETI